MTGAPTYRNGSLVGHHLVDIDIEKHLIDSHPAIVDRILAHYRSGCEGDPCIVQTKSEGLRLSAFCPTSIGNALLKMRAGCSLKSSLKKDSAHPNEDMELKHFQNSDFYRTIIDNNLFRPLGWTPPRPKEPYRLLGTIIPVDAKTPSRAIIQNTVGNQTHIVTIGDTLDTDTHITDIQTKHVTLKKNGQQRQLTLKSSFLQRR